MNGQGAFFDGKLIKFIKDIKVQLIITEIITETKMTA